jgi:2,4-dienoyl-CoA reductase-like NADH-dependent reductase (Old Yellow Enzyme family)
VRFGVIEYDGRDEQTLLDSIGLVRQFKDEGMDMISVSMGFTIPGAAIPWGPAFMGPVAQRVRNEANVPVSSAWGFGTPAIAEKMVKEEVLDVVMVGKAHLANPHWAYAAAKELGVEKAAWTLPAPYAAWLERY